MINALLDIVPRVDENGKIGYYFSEFPEALVYALIGFLIVFVGITIIIAIIWLIGLLMRKTDNLAFLTNKGKKKKEQSETVTMPQTVIEDDEIPDEVKAAIVAAIMAYYQTEQPQCEFKVKRIKRI